MRDFLQKYKTYNNSSWVDSEVEKQERENYLKYILKFSKPSEDNGRIGLELEGLSEYDFIDQESDENFLNGRLCKRFVRLHKNYFPQFVDDIKNNGGSSFVTYMDREDVINGTVPQNYSVLMKKVLPSNFFDNSEVYRKLYAEKVAPKVMTVFDLDTVYNEFSDDNGVFYIFSVDFIKPGQRFYMSNLLNGDLPLSVMFKIEDSMKSISEKIDILKQVVANEFEMPSMPLANKQELTEDFIKTLLVRGFVVGDGDFRDKNYGFLYDIKKDAISTGPAYDFEFGFSRLASRYPYVNENLKYVAENYPEIMKWFIEKLEIISQINPKTNKTIASEIVEKNVGDKMISDEISDVLNENVKFLLEKSKELESRVQMEN